MSERVLIVGTNWVGDTVISMPAVQLFAEKNPDAHITMLVRPVLGPLWRMHEAISDVAILPPGALGTLRTAWALQDGHFTQAFVLPNSVRSALIPYLAGVPARHGHPGHHRAWMLTRLVNGTSVPHGEEHQAYRAASVFGLEFPAQQRPVPRVRVPDALRDEARATLGNDNSVRWIGVAPGAARGPSKRWPCERFAAVGRHVAEAHGARVAVFGTHAERTMCDEVANTIGPRALNLAGGTLLNEAAALLALCDTVVSNDSGIMHLSAAVGTPVVAVFGLTDPACTGPLGDGHVVITRPDVEQSVRIQRQSRAARSVLESISVEEVCRAVDGVLSVRAPADGASC